MQVAVRTRTARIGDIARPRAGYQTRGRVKARPDGSHALLQLRDFDEERTRINLAGKARILPGSINKDQELRDGDVVFLTKGARSFAFVPRGLPEPALVAATFSILRPGERIHADYLAWALNSEATQRTVSRYVGQGTQMPFVPREVLQNLVIPLPDLRTQQMVAQVDALAAEQQRLLTGLAEKKRLLATALCVRAANPSMTEQESR